MDENLPFSSLYIVVIQNIRSQFRRCFWFSVFNQ